MKNEDIEIISVDLTKDEYIVINSILKTMFDALKPLPVKMRSERFYTISNLYLHKFKLDTKTSGD